MWCGFLRKRQKNLDKLENTFDFFTIEEGDKKFIARFRPSLWYIANDNIYPYFVVLTIPIDKQDNIYPGAAENDLLLILEKKLLVY